MARRRSPHGRAVDVSGSSGTTRRGGARRWQLWDFDLGGLFGRKRGRGKSRVLPKLVIQFWRWGRLKPVRVVERRQPIPTRAVYRGERARQMRGTTVWPGRRRRGRRS